MATKAVTMWSGLPNAHIEALLACAGIGMQLWMPRQYSKFPTSKILKLDVGF